MATILIKNFPDDLHHRGKIQAAVEQISLKDLFIKALTEYLKREGSPGIEKEG